MKKLMVILILICSLNLQANQDTTLIKKQIPKDAPPAFIIVAWSVITILFINSMMLTINGVQKIK